MNAVIEIHRNRAGAAAIDAHLRACDDSFVPALSRRVEIDAYAATIMARAERFEAWSGDHLIGLLAAYCNDPAQRVAFVTSVSVAPLWQGRGIASRLLRDCIEHVRRSGMQRIELEVDVRSSAATYVYKKHGFSVASTDEQTQTMQLAV